MVCGWDEVFVLDVSAAPRKVWSWKAADRPELPPAYRTKFRTTDECKPVAGNRILITASSDGAALVDRATGRTLWWGACGNAHSAELLPGDRIVLACSVREGTGNKLALFDAAEPDTRALRDRAVLGAWRRVGRDASAAVGARREGTARLSPGGLGDGRGPRSCWSIATRCPTSAATN